MGTHLRITVVVLCVCVCLSVTKLAATYVIASPNCNAIRFLMALQMYIFLSKMVYLPLLVSFAADSKLLDFAQRGLIVLPLNIASPLK